MLEIQHNIDYFLFQKKEFTSFSDAVVRLDMTGAVKDINRANYVAKVDLNKKYYLKLLDFKIC